MTLLHEKMLMRNETITSCACNILSEAGCTTLNKEVGSHFSRALLIKSLFLAGIKLQIQDIAGGGRVKPYITGMSDLHISLSHCSGLVVCAFGLMELGIDAENIRPFNKSVMLRICSREERESIMSSPEPYRMFFKYWTLKESYGKAIGEGLSYPLRNTVFFFEGARVCSSIEDYDFTLFESISGYIIALCYKKINK